MTIDCENCEDHKRIEGAISDLPEIKKSLDKVNEGVTQILAFLNGGLEKKGFITQIDERIWRLEKWKEDSDNSIKEYKGIRNSMYIALFGCILTFVMDVVLHFCFR